MRLVYINTFRLGKTHFVALIIAAVLILAGLTTVFAKDEAISVTSWSLANKVIVIDPGHGGIDPGAVGYNGLKEKDIVLDVSKHLHQVLNQAGAKVIMTRETDIDLSTPGSGSLLKRKREDLAKRVQLANTNKADLYLSIHVNAFPSSRWRGAQTFYQNKQPKSKVLAEALQSELTSILGNTTRLAKPEDFFTTRSTNMPAVIIEIGFISNPAEAKLMVNPKYQHKLAYAIYSGLAKYYSEQLPKTN